MAKFRAGRHRAIYYGTAGSTASQLIENATDVDVGGGHTRTDTTTRGNAVDVAVHTEQVVQLNRPVTFKTRYNEDDTIVSALIAAEKLGSDIALKVLRYVGGPIEINSDFTLNLNSPGPLVGGMELEWEAIPSRDSGRAPALS